MTNCLTKATEPIATDSTKPQVKCHARPEQRAPSSVRPQDIEDRVSQDMQDSHRALPAWLAG
jgi:hypothetical protein